jgi:DnaJ-class molecular chaperone
MARYKRANETWPFGKPTKPCETCYGSGMRPGAGQLITNTRRKENGPATDQKYALMCPTCEGRGRVISATGAA